MPPPPLPTPAPRSGGLAALLNLAIPGVGLFYLGRRKLGATLAALFLACFIALLGIFLVAYGRYISLATSDDLLRGDNLEHSGLVFPTAWLIGLASAGGVIQIVSMILLRVAKTRTATPDPLAPKPAPKAVAGRAKQDKLCS